MRPERTVLSRESKPYLPRHVRLQFDGVRQRFAVLAPERVYWPDEIALDILKLSDGQRTIAAIATELSQAYAAPVDTIEADVLEFTQSWADLQLLKTAQ